MHACSHVLVRDRKMGHAHLHAKSMHKRTFSDDASHSHTHLRTNLHVHERMHTHKTGWRQECAGREEGLCVSFSLFLCLTLSLSLSSFVCVCVCSSFLYVCVCVLHASTASPLTCHRVVARPSDMPSCGMSKPSDMPSCGGCVACVGGLCVRVYTEELLGEGRCDGIYDAG